MLTIGVLGSGTWDKTHFRTLQGIASCQLAGLFDPLQNTTNEFAAECGIKLFESADALIQHCDALIITNPASYQLAEKAVKQSKHVFIDHALDGRIAGIKSLMRLAGEANVKLQMGHSHRFHPVFLAAQKQIGNPLYIETERCVTMNRFPAGASVVSELMISDIDLVLSLVKANIRKISAGGVAVISDTPDIANARIEFDNGAVANLTVSRVSLENIHHTKFTRREGIISLDFLKDTASLVRPDSANGYEPKPNSSVDINSYNNHNIISLTNIEINKTNAFEMQLESFVTAILNNTRPLIMIEDSYKSLEVSNKIIDQLRLNATFAAGNTIIA